MINHARRDEMLRALATILLVLAALAYPALAQEQGLSTRKIVLGLDLPPAHRAARHLGAGRRPIWVNEINEAGGIHDGSCALVVLRDGGLAPRRGLASVRRLVDQDKVFMLWPGHQRRQRSPVP